MQSGIILACGLVGAVLLTGIVSLLVPFIQAWLLPDAEGDDIVIIRAIDIVPPTPEATRPTATPPAPVEPPQLGKEAGTPLLDELSSMLDAGSRP